MRQKKKRGEEETPHFEQLQDAAEQDTAGKRRDDRYGRSLMALFATSRVFRYEMSAGNRSNACISVIRNECLAR